MRAGEGDDEDKDEDEDRIQGVVKMKVQVTCTRPSSARTHFYRPLVSTGDLLRNDVGLRRAPREDGFGF